MQTYRFTPETKADHGGDAMRPTCAPFKGYTERDFWTEALLAALHSGANSVIATARADNAVADRRARCTDVFFNG